MERTKAGTTTHLNTASFKGKVCKLRARTKAIPKPKLNCQLLPLLPLLPLAPATHSDLSSRTVLALTANTKRYPPPPINTESKSTQEVPVAKTKSSSNPKAAGTLSNPAFIAYRRAKCELIAQLTYLLWSDDYDWMSTAKSWWLCGIFSSKELWQSISEDDKAAALRLACVEFDQLLF
jgi:hypothetical protein